MDRRLDKRYLTGAVSAMKKQYGVEKTDAIIEDAWRRYAEIVDENADEPKKMYMHTVFAKGYGFADLENNTAMDPETTVFEWGSISKTFVWVSVMQLVEDRKIDLETDIRTYLPDSFLKNLRFAEPVTLLHLMNHTAEFEEELLDLRYYSASEEIPFKEVLCSRCRNCSGHLRVFHGNQPCRKEKNQSTGPYDCFICIANYICVDARILNSSIN